MKSLWWIPLLLAIVWSVPRIQSIHLKLKPVTHKLRGKTAIKSNYIARHSIQMVLVMKNISIFEVLLSDGLCIAVYILSPGAR